MVDLISCFTADKAHQPNRVHMMHDRFIANRNTPGRYDIYLFDDEWIFMYGTTDYGKSGEKQSKNDPTSYKRHNPPLHWVRRYPISGVGHYGTNGAYDRYDNCEPYQSLDLAETFGKVDYFRRADSLWKWPSGPSTPLPDNIAPDTQCVRVRWMWGHDLEHREEYILSPGWGCWLRWTEHKGNELIGGPSDKSVMNPEGVTADCPCESWLLDDTQDWQDHV